MNVPSLSQDDYGPIVKEVADEFRKDLRCIMKCEPGNCKSARPERCPCANAALSTSNNGAGG